MKILIAVFAIINCVFATEIGRGMENQIVGGEDTEEGRYEYQVLVQFTCPGSFSSSCGGSLINESWVLTAGQCSCRRSPAKVYEVYLGRHDLSDDSEDFETKKACAIRHPGYQSRPLKSDVMLLKLETPSNYTPVQLDDGSNDLPGGTNVTVMGWGTTSEGTLADILQEVEVDIVENDQCDIAYDGAICDDMICASRSGKDSCQGDNGGPLIIKGTNSSEDVQVGIVSWGVCADPDFPGVYASVSYYFGWINGVIESGGQSKDSIFMDILSSFLPCLF